MLDHLLHPSQVARMLSVNRRTVYRWCRHFGCPYHTIAQSNRWQRATAGNRRWARIDPDQLRIWLRIHGERWRGDILNPTARARIAAFVGGN